MEYTINELATLSGVTVRTLHHYDQIGLLCPRRMEGNEYRIYGEKEVNLLQQILFYRELEVPLKKIKQIVHNENFDKEKELREQLEALVQKRNQIDTLIDNLKKTIDTLKGDTVMSDEEKFKGFKQELIEENEKKYGKEVRKKYGDAMIEQTNAKFTSMSQADWEKSQELNEQILKLLKEAFQSGDPAGELAQRVCELHRQWLCMFWAEGTYSKEAHLALAEGYVADERFTAYYDKMGKGCTKFLRDAIEVYVNSEQL